MSALEKQEGGDHYKKYPIQPVEYNHANNIPYIEGECIAKLTRWRDKGGLEDLRKVIHSVQLLIELEEKRATKKARRWYETQAGGQVCQSVHEEP